MTNDNESINDSQTTNSIQQQFNGYGEYEMDIMTENDNSVSSYKKKLQKIDRGHHIITIIDKHGKPRKVEVFSVLNMTGTNIRDAVTGVTYNIKVGSVQSEQFFKVKNSVHKDIPSDNVLFYDNPEQYERHTKTELSDSIKKKWRDRFVSRVIDDKLVA